MHWNSFERCWDCPCHGSQFAPDGTALNGPAFAPFAEHKEYGCGVGLAGVPANDPHLRIALSCQIAPGRFLNLSFGSWLNF